MNAAAKLWLAGAELDWSGFYSNERRQRVALPTYPFERKRHWIDRPVAVPEQQIALDEPQAPAFEHVVHAQLHVMNLQLKALRES
jgi:acyl transferase domain-containing protein